MIRELFIGTIVSLVTLHLVSCTQSIGRHPDYAPKVGTEQRTKKPYVLVHGSVNGKGKYTLLDASFKEEALSGSAGVGEFFADVRTGTRYQVIDFLGYQDPSNTWVYMVGEMWVPDQKERVRFTYNMGNPSFKIAKMRGVP